MTKRKGQRFDRESSLACGSPKLTKNAAVRSPLFMQPSPSPFVIPSVAEGSAVTFPGKTELPLKTNCHLDRSVAEWRDLRYSSRPLRHDTCHPIPVTTCTVS